MLICLQALLFTRPETRASYSPFPLSVMFPVFLSLFLFLSLARALSSSPYLSLYLPLAFAIRASSSPPSPLSPYLFPVRKYRDDSANRVARRPQVDGEKFGITVSTMFNHESTHNVECVGLVR